MSYILSVVRHGETDDNAKKIIQGHLDTPLNSQGEAQALVLAKYCKEIGLRFDEAWSSDLGRAKKTAEIVLREQGDPCELKTDERIRERFLGELQGKSWGTPGVDLSTIESTSTFQARLLSFFDSRFPPNPPPHTYPTSNSNPRHVAFFSHGGSIRQLVRGLVDDRSKNYTVESKEVSKKTIVDGTAKRVGNCSVTEIVMDLKDGQWFGRLTKYAEEDHFVDSSRVPSPTGNADVID